MGYDEIKKELEDLPTTWHPALLKALVESAVKKHVFLAGGLTSFVRQVEFKALYGPVFDLLVSIGGAPESMRQDFLHHHSTEQPCDEYRFQGHLGFGGKYRRKTNRVDCYPEDETLERKAIIMRLNMALVALPHFQNQSE